MAKKSYKKSAGSRGFSIGGIFRLLFSWKGLLVGGIVTFALLFFGGKPLAMLQGFVDKAKGATKSGGEA